MNLPNLSMPVSRLFANGVHEAALGTRGGVTPAGIACTLCLLACDALAPTPKALCIAACNATVCG